MITEAELVSAIKECEGVRNPNANTCIKLASFLTIKDHLYPDKVEGDVVVPQKQAKQDVGGIISIENPKTDFMQAVNGCRVEDVLGVIDDAMGVLFVKNSALYDAILRNIEQL